jgi:hypothetical protein
MKCWTPSFVKDESGRRKEDLAGMPYERQPRRTLTYFILCEAEPRRTILLAPLKPVNMESEEVPHGRSAASAIHFANISAGIAHSEKPSSNDDRSQKGRSL